MLDSFTNDERQNRRSTTGGKQTHEIGNQFAIHGTVNMALLPAAADQTGAAQQVEMVGERRAWNAERFLNFPDGDFAPRLHEEEENLQARKVGQCFQGFHMAFGGLQPGGNLRARKAFIRFHISKYTEIWKSSPGFFEMKPSQGRV